jgi:tRNA-Thr(GGU) m(6)t(6)A37 methyltransferase TsaA
MLNPAIVFLHYTSGPLQNPFFWLRTNRNTGENRFEVGDQSRHEFSHIEVLFHFNRLPAAEVQMGARHPRGREDWPKVGIFAQRGKARPNRIGVTVCKLLCVERATIKVEGLDAIDGTPVLDIKPYMHQFGPRGNVRQPRWADELMSRYWSSSQEHE